MGVTRKSKMLLKCMTDGWRSSLAFLKANYILKQKVHELAHKKRNRIGYYQMETATLSPKLSPQPSRMVSRESQATRSSAVSAVGRFWRQPSDLSSDHSDPKFNDMEILRTDLMMTGLLPDSLNMKDEAVHKKLNESGFLAYGCMLLCSRQAIYPKMFAR